jgi:hypothetical protein
MQTMKDMKLGWSLGLVLVWSGAAFAADATAPAYPITQSAAQPAPPTATPAPPPAAGAKRSAADLEKLVAPIALYPDPLLATLLPASVYPLEIVQAARFVADTNNLAKLDAQPWDDNVKAVARVPDAIKKLNDDIAWTIELGDAFLAQDKDVMDAIQSMRGKAQKAGTLQTTPQQVVTVTNVIIEKTVEQRVVVVTNTVVQIQPASSTVVYVPTYNPYTVYYPPPAYVYNPMAPLVTFGAGMAMGAIIANNCDWYHGGCYHGDVDIDIDRTVNRNVDRNVDRTGNRAGQTSARQKWQPDQSRLSKSGSPSATSSARSAEARGWSSGGAKPSTGSVGARPSTGTAAARPSTGAAAARPSTGSAAARPTSTWQQPSASRSTPSPSASPPRASTSASRPSSSGGAFSGANSGASTRSASSRGASSRSSGGFSGGGGGGRGGGRR